MAPSLKRLKRVAVAGMCVVLALLCMEFCIIFLFDAGSVEVRIDSGDRRIRGLILSWPERPVPGREYIVRAAVESGIPSEWHRPPFTAPSNPDQGRFFQYSRIAWWTQHEPALGRLLLQQFADYYRNPPAESGLPPTSYFLLMLDWEPERSCYMLAMSRITSWGEGALQQLLDESGYIPESGGVVAELFKRNALTLRADTPTQAPSSSRVLNRPNSKTAM